MKSPLIQLVRLCLLALVSSVSSAAVIPTYFGWNLVYVPGNDSTRRFVWQLKSISYVGEANVGLVDPASPYSTPLLDVSMPSHPGFDVTFGTGEISPPHDGPFEFQGLPDAEDYQWPVDNSITFPQGGNGTSTRDVATTIDIDWVPAGVDTPWGNLPFPSIGILEIETVPYGYYDFLDINEPFRREQNPVADTGTFDALLSQSEHAWYIVGLIPSGFGSELNSGLSNPQNDIYDNMAGTFFPSMGLDEFRVRFSAAAVALPASLWYFISGLLGLFGIFRCKKAG